MNCDPSCCLEQDYSCQENPLGKGATAKSYLCCEPPPPLCCQTVAEGTTMPSLCQR